MINNQNLAVLSEKVARLESAVANSIDASGISYDNTDSGLTADNVQGAIDEIVDISSLDITTENTNGLEGSHFVKNGVAYVNGYFIAKSEIPANAIIGTFNKNIKGVANWIGVRVDNLSIVRGYIIKEENNTNLYSAQTIPANISVVMSVVYEIE